MCHVYNEWLNLANLDSEMSPVQKNVVLHQHRFCLDAEPVLLVRPVAIGLPSRVLKETFMRLQALRYNR